MTAPGRHGAGLRLPECPTFRPTAEEFADPLRYLFGVVRPAAEHAGIARIVPPPGFRPPFAISRRSFRFRTRVQAVNELQERGSTARAVRRFWEDYGAFQQRRGQRAKKPPTVAGQAVDLYKLSRLVARRGGYGEVTVDKGWRAVAEALQVGAPPPLFPPRAAARRCPACATPPRPTLDPRP